MRRIYLSLLFLLLAAGGHSQVNKADSFNFSFELTEKGIPRGWSIYGSQEYAAVIDSGFTKDGRYAASIESIGTHPDFKTWVYTFPGNYEGRRITLSGYIKTENVTEGYAGFWMRLDPGIAYMDMSAEGVKGTSDWKHYEISLDMNPGKTKQIAIGGSLKGKGKMWMDDLKISIDGKDIKVLKPMEKYVFLADKDQEFDKGSGITAIPLDRGRIENLKILGLVWGFLKYYHPAIAQGKYNWDYELFRILPEIINAKHEKDRDVVLVRWIHSLGPFEEKEHKELFLEKIKTLPDLDWLSSSHLSKDLSALLLKIRNALRPEEHYYVALPMPVGNPDFSSERAYGSMEYPDAGFRLLALYRYWNIIQYYFPYKNLIEEDWKNVLEEFIPKIIRTDNKTEYTLTLLELIGRVHDTHANIWGGTMTLKAYRGEKYAPLYITFVEGKPVVTGYPDEKTGKATGLRVGDIITSVNGKPFEQIIRDQLKYYPASNYPTQLRDIADNLLRSNDTVIAVTFTREQEHYESRISTFPPMDINFYGKYMTKDTGFKFITKDIAYINNGSVKREHLPMICREIEGTKGLIIDNRNYPADFVLYDLCKYILPRSIPFSTFTNGSIKYPGLFSFREPAIVGTENKDYYKGKVIILVNEISQSSSEFHAMAYRVHPNAIVIGSTTAGADGNVSQFYLPGGISTMISGVGIYYPDGRETQRIGIVPDIVIKPTIAGLRKGRDEVLDKAIEVINQ